VVLRARPRRLCGLARAVHHLPRCRVAPLHAAHGVADAPAHISHKLAHSAAHATARRATYEPALIAALVVAAAAFDAAAGGVRKLLPGHHLLDVRLCFLLFSQPYGLFLHGLL